MPFAMADRNELPSFLAAVHPRFHTPYIAIVFTAAISLVLTLSGTFIYALTISTLTRLASYAVTCAALPLLRRREDLPPAGFIAPAGTLIAAMVLLLAVWLLWNSTKIEARDAAIAAAAGLVVYFCYRFLKTRRRNLR
jgi:amino acid transporter